MERAFPAKKAAAWQKPVKSEMQTGGSARKGLCEGGTIAGSPFA